MDKIGLIAGSSRFPVILAEAAKKRGVKVFAVALKEETSPELERVVDKICWVNVGELGKAVDFLKKEEIRNAVMAGKVRLSHIYDKSLKPDGYLKNILIKAADKRGDTLLLAVAGFLRRIGVRLLDCAMFLRDDIVKKGALTNVLPVKEQIEDIKFARPIIKLIAGMRIGQTIIVKNKAVVAIEALEGTDGAVKRAGRLCGEGAVIVKMSSPKQDIRFDIPLIGPSTIEAMKEAKAKVLAIEAGRTLIIDRKEFIRLAEEAGVCVIGV